LVEIFLKALLKDKIIKPAPKVKYAYSYVLPIYATFFDELLNADE